MFDGAGKSRVIFYGGGEIVSEKLIKMLQIWDFILNIKIYTYQYKILLIFFYLEFKKNTFVYGIPCNLIFWAPMCLKQHPGDIPLSPVPTLEGP